MPVVQMDPGLHEPGTEYGHADSLRLQLYAQSLHQAHYRKLGSRIHASGSSMKQAAHRARRRDMRRLSVAKNAWQKRANGIDDAEDICIERMVPIFDRGVADSGSDSHSGIAADQVDSPESSRGRAGSSRDGVTVPNVCFDREYFSTESSKP
jgi:hypothetical protein